MGNIKSRADQAAFLNHSTDRQAGHNFGNAAHVHNQHATFAVAAPPAAAVLRKQYDVVRIEQIHLFARGRER